MESCGDTNCIAFNTVQYSTTVVWLSSYFIDEFLCLERPQQPNTFDITCWRQNTFNNFFDFLPIFKKLAQIFPN